MFFLYFIDSSAEAKLKVYQNNGTTVLGNLVEVTGTDATSCNGLTYANTTTGAIAQIPEGACSSATTARAYYSDPNCTGTIYSNAVGGQRRFRYSTGSDARVCDYEGSFTNVHTNSYRDWSGSCVNTYTSFLNPTSIGRYTNCIDYTDVCNGGPCVVKP